MDPANPPQFRVKRPRPLRLSDPHGDFPPEFLAKLLQTPDEELQGRHFQHLLGPFLPAGTYEESSYFLPLACRHVLAHPEDALDLSPTIIGFMYTHAEGLRRDGLEATALTWIRHWLQGLTWDFIVVHVDREACRQKGWQREYVDSVVHSEAVCHILVNLDRFAAFGHLALEFVRHLASGRGGANGAAWFLELVRARDDVYHPPTAPEIQAILGNRLLWREKQAVVQRYRVAADSSPTYWRDLFAKLELDA